MIIAHRGNTKGPSSEENSPEYILQAIKDGYYVEVDVHLLENGDIFLGHDAPTYKVELDFFNEFMFVHLKRYAQGHKFFENKIKYFIQENEPCVVVYNSYFYWCHSSSPQEGNNYILTNLSGVIEGRWTCTDYV